MSNVLKPTSQRIYINSSQGRIFDFNTHSSRTYFGEVVNSLLRVFGNNVVISGFRILTIEYDSNNILHVVISSGEVIVDHTLVKYPYQTELSIDVSDLDDTGIIVPNLFFKFSQTQQKNHSTIQLSYVSEDGIPLYQWFNEYSIVLFAIIDFNKTEKTAIKRPIFALNRDKITIKNKEFTIYPFDNISNRILMYINDKFN